jgi:hypothetical protein
MKHRRAEALETRMQVRKPVVAVRSSDAVKSSRVIAIPAAIEAAPPKEQTSSPDDAKLLEPE